MMLRSVLTVFFLTVGLCACASLTKDFTPSEPTQSTHPTQPTQPASADTKQRVVLQSSAGVICAEPSAGLLAALSGSPGGGASAQDKAAAPPAAVREAAVAAILKTQWSALMRDQLYRICEAYYNKAIGGPQVMELILRSQDLAFATVALEQLAGAVSSRSAATAGPGAAPWAGVAQLQVLLDLSRRNEQTKNAFVQTDAQALEHKKVALEQAQAALNSADSKRVSDEEKKQLAAAVAQAKLEVAAAAQNLKEAQDLADEATRTRLAIEKGLEIAQAGEKAPMTPPSSATPSAQAATSDQASIAQVAVAVKDIVEAVVNRDYLAQGCFALLTTDSAGQTSPEQAKAREEQVKFCMGVI